MIKPTKPGAQPNIIDSLCSARNAVGNVVPVPLPVGVDRAINAMGRAANCINSIATALDRREWDADTCVAIADVLRAYGIEVHDTNDDHGLTADELATKYGTSDHPVFTKDDWRQQVWESRTLSAYWTWVVDQIAASEVLELPEQE